MAGEAKEAAIAALRARADDEIADAERIVRTFRIELERAQAAGGGPTEMYQALVDAGYRLDRQRFEAALADPGQYREPAGEREPAPGEPPEPVSGYAPGYDSGQF